MSTQGNSMNTMFIAILQKLITEQGKEALVNPSKCKAFLADYTKGEYKKESRLLLQALEAGVQKEIITTKELEICKKQQARILREEHFVAAEAAEDIVDTLALVLRDENKNRTSQRVVCTNCNKELQKEWLLCPYCGTRVENTSSLSKEKTPQKKDTAPSNSENTIDNTQQIKPVTASTISVQQKKLVTASSKPDNIPLVNKIAVVILFFILIAVIYLLLGRTQ
jgi:DNA-directed RNA polymerase subunit RPC12/RpoP